MKKNSLLILVLLAFSVALFSQEAMDISVQLDKSFIPTGNIIGKTVPTGRVITKEDGHLISSRESSSILWNLTIEVKNAKAIILYFDELIIKDGAKIRAYSLKENDRTKYFYKNENKLTKSFALPYVKGDKIVLEAIFPNSAAYDAFSFGISEIGGLVSLTSFGQAPSCYANVKCSEALPWADQVRSVAKYTTVIGGRIGACSGSLVNNTSGDCKNYFLSAEHCVLNNNIATAAEFGQFVFYFNYQANSCTSPTSDAGLDQQTVVGCTKIATSGKGSNNGIPDGSDFSLMELNTIPKTYNVYYAGWNRSPRSQLKGPGATIQHPRGDLKKISFWDIEDEAGTVSAGHLALRGITSANGSGIVEAMSSGSPVFDVNKNIIANVTAGASGCLTSSSNEYAIAGRFELNWDSQVYTGDAYQLKPWLDPTNSGVMFLNGKQNCNSTSTNEVRADKVHFSVHPNPASNYIQLQSDQPIEKITLYSIVGKILLTSPNTKTIDISRLPSGIIIVQADIKGGRIAYNKIYKQ